MASSRSPSSSEIADIHGVQSIRVQTNGPSPTASIIRDESIISSLNWEELGNNVFSSAIAGLVGRLVCHPMDTMKARIQAPSTTSKEFSGLLAAFRTTIKYEGMTGLYRGLGAAIVGGIPATSLYLTTYELTKKAMMGSDIGRQSPFLTYFCSGIIAEAASCIIFVPVDVVKERLQVQIGRSVGMNLSIHSPTTSISPATATASSTANTTRMEPISPAAAVYRNSYHAMRTIFAEEGIRGIYRGYGATLLSFGPFSALYFLFYEKVLAPLLIIASTDIISNEICVFLCCAVEGTCHLWQERSDKPIISTDFAMVSAYGLYAWCISTTSY